jgi:death on curing protein
MLPPIRFLSVDDVLLLHQSTTQEEGGLAGLRDLGLLESAVMTPQQQFAGQFLHEDLAAMAAAYLFHLVRNHPFLDGNKRVGALALLIFLDGNSVRRLPPSPALERITLEVAEGHCGKEELTKWLRQVSFKKPR